jgi:hypothetical protein
MKKIIYLLLVSSLMALSCKKDRIVETTIKGQLITNGTIIPIKMSVELPKPIITLYHEFNTSDYTGCGFEIITSVSVDNNGNFSFGKIDLINNDDYFIGYSKIDSSIYFEVRPDQWRNADTRYNYISTGSSNTINLNVLAKSWVRFRFVNSNPDVNNNDVFHYWEGGGTPGCPMWDFYGKYDSLMPWLYRTWSGRHKYGIMSKSYEHLIEGVLSRNGSTRDTTISYFVPPFDTTQITIMY